MGFFKRKKVKVLIYGSGGWIGGLFIKYLKETHPKIEFIEGLSRTDDTHRLPIELKAHRPSHVISFTGRTHGKIDGYLVNTIDYLEYPGKTIENVRDNLFGPLILADLCVKNKIHYTYLGTGCIFDSNDLDTDTPEMFNEESEPNYFGSSYSVVKGFTDRLMKNYSVLNLRIRMPISSEKNSRNFITKITGYSKICSINNSMTVLDDFFPIFVDLMLKNKVGTYNCTNPGIISHNTVLELYNKYQDPHFQWKNFTIAEQSIVLKSDRSNNKLDTTKIEREYPELKCITESLIDIMGKYK